MGLGVLHRGGMKPNRGGRQQQVFRLDQKGDFRSKDGPLTRARDASLTAAAGSSEREQGAQKGWTGG